MQSGKFPISFEFFPPKTLAGQDNLLNAATLLSRENPYFFSMTYGAGGSTRDGTISMVGMLHDLTKVPLTPHLSCIGSTRAELIEILQVYQSLNVNRIVALRGDLPSGMGQAGELHYANELVALIREITGDYFHIEVAAYPECHPQAKNARQDLINFKKKIDAGANSAITQYFFNPDAYFHFLEECAKANIFIPIVPGVMPITNYSKLSTFSERCGAEIPRWMQKQFESYADDIESIQAFGLEVVYRLCERLIEGGAPGIHFYTLNHAEPTTSLLQLLGVSKRELKLSVVPKSSKTPLA